LEESLKITRDELEELDRQDPLKIFRDEFDLPEGTLYFDGNSLGALPKATPARINEVVAEEWGKKLVTSWNSAGWFSLPETIGNKIAHLIGADDGEVVCVDGTGLNIYKLHAVALKMRAGRKVILMEGSNFPTDAYITQGLIDQLAQGHEIRFVEKNEILGAITEDVALVSLTQVHYKMGHLLDMKAITQKAHDVGALVMWDLSHSAGALPVALNGCDVDFAVGCTYKYLNGGPGAPAYLFVAKRHQGKETQPLTGWWSHERPFAFEQDYQPKNNIGQFLSGTQPIVSLAAVEVGVDLLLSADMDAIRQKSLALGDTFIQLIKEHLSEYGFTLATPIEPTERGSQISLCSENGYAIMQALIEAGVLGDFRAPDNMRFGLTPLYTRYTDLWDAVLKLKSIMENDTWRAERFSGVSEVT
jgi:kynureninase